MTHRDFVSRLFLVTAGLAACLSWSGCSTFKPAPESFQPQLSRAITQTNGPIVVSTAVLGRKEAQKMFDLPLHKKRIQPVWLRFENQGTNNYHFLVVTLDRDYHSAGEVGYMFRKACRSKRNRTVTAFVQDNQISMWLEAGQVVEGFVYANYTPGAKHVVIELLGDNELKQLEFVAPVPGKRFDFERVDWDNLYTEEEIRDVTLDELRTLLTELPIAVTDAKGKRSGDPVNIVVVGSQEEAEFAFARQGWDYTESLTAGSTFKLIRSFLFNSYWETSPVSSLYLFGRRQDFALQKARGTIHERNHLRLWLAPYTYEGKDVWVGQISRDIGLRFTTRAPGFVTHKIDPDVDEARDYLSQDMVTSHSVRQLAVVGGVGEVSPDEPRRNLTGDPYYTDGHRTVFFLSKDWVPPDQVEIVDWTADTESSQKGAEVTQ